MKTVGVVMDDWRVTVFRRHLDAAGYEYSEHPGPTPNTRILKVTCEWVHKLKEIIDAAEAECAQIKTERE